MLDTILSVVSTFGSTIETVKKGYDAYKQVCAIARGETHTSPLDRIATSFERLSERILYAPNLHAVEDVSRTQQQYVNDLRAVREVLDPVQRAVGTDILSSAMILTPEKMRQTLVKNPWDVLMDVRPVPLDGSAWVTGGEQDWHLLRGGSWGYDAYACRSANRSRNADKSYSNGFRLSCSG